MILYIHGFGSSGGSSKAELFREFFRSKGKKFIAPTLSYIPTLAMQTLEEIITIAPEPVSLIGSSLGGYYSLYLGEKYSLKSVLINPAVNPQETLRTFTGINTFDNSQFEWRRDTHVDMLDEFETTHPGKTSLLLVQKGDDTLPYYEAVQRLPEAEQIIEEGGSHSFDNIERHLERIFRFLEVNV